MTKQPPDSSRATSCCSPASATTPSYRDSGGHGDRRDHRGRGDSVRLGKGELAKLVLRVAVAAP
jgi:hypothetical protein